MRRGSPRALATAGTMGASAGVHQAAAAAAEPMKSALRMAGWCHS